MESNSVGKFIYKGKHKKFNYLPRFYNPSKEFLDERKQHIENELRAEKGEYVSKVHLGMFKNQRVKKKQSLTDVLGSNLLFILILLSIPVAWIIYGEIALWLGGVCLTLPLIVKILYFRGFFDKKH